MPTPRWLRLLPPALQARFAGRRSLQAIVHNTGWLLLDKLIRLALGLLVGAWVARYLGPTQYGELAYALAYIGFFQSVALLGLDGIVVRDLARDSSNAGEILGTAFALRLGCGLLCWLLAIGAMAWVKGWQDPVVSIVALVGASLVFQAADTIDLWFQSQTQSRRTVSAKLFAYLVSNGIKVGLILQEAPLAAFAAAIALEWFAAAVGLAYAYRSFQCNQKWRRVKLRAEQLLRESWPFAISAISIMVYMRIDQIMIKEMLGEEQLGIYAAVLPLATVWQFIPMALFISLAPFVARAKQSGEREYMEILGKVFRLFSLLGWVVCLLVTLCAQVVINLLFGGQYESGWIVLVTYVLTNIFINLGVAQGLWVLNEGKGTVNLYKTLAGACVCVGGNLILIPLLGIFGAAVVAVIAQFVSAVFSNIWLAPAVFRMQISALFLLPITRVERT